MPSGKLVLPANDVDDPASIALALSSIRKHLGMEVAYVSEFVDGRSVFREVDAPGLESLIKVGDSQSLDDVYCRHILLGRLPELMADTADHPLATTLPITAMVGAHLSVPIRLPGGEVFGMFCCLSPQANRTLNDRDLGVMRVFAEMAAAQLGRGKAEERRALDQVARIEHVIADAGFEVVLQPIWEFGSARPRGFEALSRFSALPSRTPDLWFQEAAEVGLGVSLEMATLTEALATLRVLPADIYLSVNASPATILSGELPAAFAGYPLQRIVLEVTEHSLIDDYAQIGAALAPLRARGMKLAVDDAGAGYASFRHILRLAPDMIKLDMALTRSVDTDLSRRALVSAMVLFARETGSQVVAEGVETEAEWLTLHGLGIQRGQGFLLGHPGDLEAALALVGRVANAVVG
jgi:EAL domain-containing protein (putative c-di-GMP-specific phosphodiesterase class I)